MYHLKQVKLSGAPFASLVGSLKLSKKDSACRLSFYYSQSGFSPKWCIETLSALVFFRDHQCPMTALQLELLRLFMHICRLWTLRTNNWLNIWCWKQEFALQSHSPFWWLRTARKGRIDLTKWSKNFVVNTLVNPLRTALNQECGRRTSSGGVVDWLMWKETTKSKERDRRQPTVTI